MAREAPLAAENSDGEDSDTIVISSHSKILISPRKKGSKAVTRLLQDTLGVPLVSLDGARREGQTATATATLPSSRRQERQHNASDRARKETPMSSRQLNRGSDSDDDDDDDDDVVEMHSSHGRRRARGTPHSSTTHSSTRRHSTLRKSEQKKPSDQLSVEDSGDDRETMRYASNARATLSSSSSSSASSPDAASRRSRATSARGAPSDLDESIVIPTPTQEMEDLKVTLKRLAHHTDATSTATEWAATSTRRTRTDTAASGSRRRYREKSSDSDDASSTGSVSSSSPPIARKLFSTPPPPTKRSTGQATPSSTKSTRAHLSRVAFSTPLGTKSSSGSVDFKTSSALNGLNLDSSISSKLTTTPTSSAFSTPTSSASSSAQGSRAVLSALKSLQDKIRRLEDEREKLLQELSDVKVKARKREAEAASLEKKLTYELGQSKDAARAAYESMRSEKEELKLELVRFTEQRKALEAELQHAERLAATQASKADDLRNQLQASTEQQQSLRNGRKKTLLQLETLKATHKHELRELQTQVNALQSERDSANERIERLDSLLEQESTNHAETRERLRDSEQMLAAITQLNEKLVAKVWESQDAVNKITKKNKRLLQQQRTSTLTRPTASSLASAAAAAKSSSATKGTSKRVASTASGAIKDKKKASTKPHASSSANNLELLRAANLSSDIPFLLGTSPNRSFSIIGNVQEALRQCDTTYATPDTLAKTTTPPSQRTSTLKAKKKTRKSTAESSAKATTTSSSILGVSSSDLRRDDSKSKAHAAPTLVAARTSRAFEDSASKRPRPPAIRVPVPATSYAHPMQSQIIEDLEAAVSVAETEFNSLNAKYRDMVAQVERGADGAAAQLSAAMGPTLDELEAKGKQLHRLKQVLAQASRSSINPIRRVVHSPEALARKTASLRILHDYRQLEREAQRPHSPTTRSPCRRSTRADTPFLVDGNDEGQRESILS